MLPKPSEVFISFYFEEISIAEAVHSLIKGFRYSGFMACPSSIGGGRDWLKRIEHEIKHTKVVVLLLSRVSVKRAWVNFEAGAAWLRKKMLVPVCYGGLRRLPDPYLSLRLEAINLETDPQLLMDCIAGKLGKRPTPRKAAALYKSLAKELKKKRKSKPKGKRAASRAGRRSLQSRILDLYPSSGHYGTSATDIAEILKVSHRSVEDALRQLEVKGQMHSLGVHWFRGPTPNWGKAPW